MYSQLHICIDASVGINILILKYKGEGEEGCGLSEMIQEDLHTGNYYFAHHGEDH
jgi:hypothetical protein